MQDDVERIVRALSGMRDEVALAINSAWNAQGEVPFPLYQREAEALADAALDSVRSALLSSTPGEDNG